MTNYRVRNDEGVQALDYNNLLYLLGGRAVVSGLDASASASTMGVDITAGQQLRNGSVSDVPAQTVTPDPGEPDAHRRDLIVVDENDNLAVQKGTPVNEYEPDITDGSGNVDLSRLFEPYQPAVDHQTGNLPIADVAVPAGTEDIDDRHIRNRSLESVLSLFDLSVEQLFVSNLDADTYVGDNLLENLTVGGATADYRVHEKIAEPGTASSYVILLEEFNSTSDDYTRGEIVGKRSAGSTAVTDRVTVDTSSSDGGSHRGHIIVHRSVPWSTSFWDLVTCDYNGVSYVALRYDSADENASHDDGVFFTGESGSTAAENLTYVQFRDGTGTVTNAEVNDSLTPVADRTGFDSKDTVDFQVNSLTQNGEAIGAGGGSGGSGGLTYSEGQMTLPSGDHRNLGAPIPVPVDATLDVYQVAVTGSTSLDLQLYNLDTSTVVATYSASYNRGDPINSHAVGGDTVVPRLSYSGSGTADGVAGMIQFDVIEGA